jgi:hypothetical protein
MVMINLIWATVFLVCFVVAVFFGTISPVTVNLKTWCETRKHVSDNKKEVEFRRLEVLEKTPELRELIFHPKTLEKEEKTSV